MDAWPWLEPSLVALAVVNLGVALVCFGLLALGRRAMKRLEDVPAPAPANWPSVSLIAPARNEARNIERAVRSLVAIDYPDLEITLVDDRSTDGTGARLDALAAEYPRLNVVHLHELPRGWLGKNHAMQLGAARSRGEWLLFTDADVVFERSALRRALAVAIARRVDHLVVMPDIRMPSWLLKAFVVTFATYFSLYFRVWAVSNPQSSAHVGVGAFNLVRATAYRAVGGHERIRMRPDDDLKLGKILKQGGYRQAAVHGQSFVGVDWYASFRELVHGLEKNAFSGCDYRVGVVVWSSLTSLLFSVWPYFAVFLVPAPAAWVYLAVCLTLWSTAATMALGLRAPPSCALAYPVTVLVFVYIQWRTMLLNYRDDGIRWRDTHYSLAELRANKV